MNHHGYRGGQLVSVIPLWWFHWQVADSNCSQLWQMQYTQSVQEVCGGLTKTPIPTLQAPVTPWFSKVPGGESAQFCIDR